MHIHVVKRGDTLSSIAAMHDALPAFVAADNGLTLSTPLVIGQALVVRTPKTLHTVRGRDDLAAHVVKNRTGVAFLQNPWYDIA